MGEDEIFVKPLNKPIPKKRELTDAQLAGLAKGRAKMAEKRAKIKEDTENENIKMALEDVKVVEENKKNQKKSRANKKKITEKQKKLISEERENIIKAKFQMKRQKKIDDFIDLKYKFMEECKNETEMEQYKSILDKIDEGLILDDKKLHTYLLQEADKFRVIQPTPTPTLPISEKSLVGLPKISEQLEDDSDIDSDMDSE